MDSVILELDVGAMQIEPPTAPRPCKITNLNRSKEEPPNLEPESSEEFHDLDASASYMENTSHFFKTHVSGEAEAPEADDIQLQLLHTIKSEIESTEDKCRSTSLTTLEQEVISSSSVDRKLETVALACSSQRIIQELLHEELDIKMEEEMIQEPSIDHTNNRGNPLSLYTSSVKSFNCSKCDYHCGLQSDLQKHFRTHTGEKPFQCNICDKNFVQNGQLKIHLRTHTGEKPFKCNICDYSCTTNSYLKIHLRTHTGEKPFICNICNFCSTTNGYLKIHLRTHTGEKPFKCNICDYSCAQNGAFKIHLRSHFGEKPFNCNICDYTATTSGHLKLHLRIHTGEKPFKCNICGKGFSDKRNRKTHLITHTGEKPFKCNICDYSCTTNGSLKNHLRTHM